MIKGLRAAVVKSDADGEIVLKKNKPIQINECNNHQVFYITEENEHEVLYIHSTLMGESFAVLGNEYWINFRNNPKKVDMTYHYYPEGSKAIAYLYDMKKTFAGEHHILDLIEQWKSSIIMSEYCAKDLEYESCEIHIGVVTEHDDYEQRKRDIEPILNPSELSVNDALPSFVGSKHRANNSGNLSKAKILDGFLDGKVTICGYTYTYDVRLFDENKKHHMYFVNGILQK